MAAPSRVYVGQLCVGSVAASTGLILINKSVMELYGFRYVLCLATYHCSRQVELGLSVCWYVVQG